MPPPSPPTTARQEPPWLEMALRSCLLGLYLAIAFIYGRAFLADPTRWTVLLLLVAEGITLVLVLLARRAIVRDASPLTVVVTVVGTVPGFLYSPDGVQRLIPEWAGAALLLVGIAVELSAKLALGRQFAALPSQRGDIVVRGPYRLLRHPMYLGYVIIETGFLLPNFSVRNAVVLVVLIGLRVYRILAEERLLSRDPAYAEYAGRVRHRVVPGVW